MKKSALIACLVACAAPIDVDIVRYADSLSKPYCGAGAEMAARGWLSDGGAQTKSLALLPLRKGADPKSFELALEYARAFNKSPGLNSVQFAAPQAPINRWRIAQ